MIHVRNLSFILILGLAGACLGKTFEFDSFSTEQEVQSYAADEARF